MLVLYAKAAAPRNSGNLGDSMKKWINQLILWYLRRHNGEVSTWSMPPGAQLRHTRKYHVVLLQEHHYIGLKMNTTWSRGSNL